ncbi:MAG: TonB-dependent receptor [Gammaproteobacteria bacterium]
MLKTLMVKSSLIAAVCSFSIAAYAFADAPRQIDVPAGDLITALESIAKQAEVQLVFRPEQLKGLRTGGISGMLSTQDAVRKLLEGTHLQLRTDESSGAMMIGEPTPTAPKPGPHGENENGPASPAKTAAIEEVTVTGSRLLTKSTNGPQDVKTFTREHIERSGQTSVADFLNTLPAVGQSVTENASQNQTFGGATTVQIHGLPMGTTLILINGRRVNVSGSTQAFGAEFFDLNNVPLSAVERVEVISEGSSAVYGSDAIAGVVNIVLKKDFEGAEVSAKYGFADGTDEWNGSVALGRRWDRGSVSVVGTFQTRTPLFGSEREITANRDYTRYGGVDYRNYYCLPGNVYFKNGYSFNGQAPVSYAAVPTGYTGQTTIQEFAGTAGTLNKCSNTYSGQSFIPAVQREGVVAQGSYKLSESLELFAEMIFSHNQEKEVTSAVALSGSPSSQTYTVSANNPYNPFGTTVGISALLSGEARNYPLETTYYRPLIGARGSFFDSWQWEVSGWDSVDKSTATLEGGLNKNAVQAALNSSDPAVALNPFIDGPLGSADRLQSLVQSKESNYRGEKLAANGFVRGTVLTLPSGPVQLVIGTEYARDEAYTDQNALSTLHRDAYAFFGETRVPIIGNSARPQAGDTLALTLAGRYDHYSDFGGKTTPQIGGEWRPVDSLLLRATYGKAFKAPSLYELGAPPITGLGSAVDTKRGNTPIQVNMTGGGNSALEPESGQSRTLGLVYSSGAIPGLEVSVTHWRVDESNSIQQIGPQTIIDNDTLFPGRLVREASCAGAQPCPIVTVNYGYVNFGDISVAGFDYRVGYTHETPLGEFAPSISATETYHFDSALTPGSPSVDGVSKAISFGSWAPRWKAVAALAWKQGPYAASLTGRYTGEYLDYQTPANTNRLGRFWFYDANLRYSIGEALMQGDHWLRGSSIEVGGVNLLNKLPQFSNFSYGFGYDSWQADIRGRFLYAQLRVKW